MKKTMLAVATLLSAPAIAQTDPADRLAANLVILAQNPRDVRALTEAGLNAVAVGDGNAALSFFSKAEAIAPNDGRIKAGLASALLLLEKPGDSIKLFNEAVALGVPEADIAGDRGLAYDLRGDGRRAQREYALALRNRSDDEITRRYALSLGISGDREEALKLLDPLLRRQDLAAWRARAFIMAMTGDVSGAESLTQKIMPGGAGASMSPFLQRLAKLDPANRAMAVNLGIMPSDGTQFALAGPVVPAPVASGGGLIPAGDPLGSRVEDALPRRVEPVSRDPRRRPGRESVTLTPVPSPQVASTVTPAPVRVTGARIENRIGPVDPARLPPAIRDQGVLTATVVPGLTALPPPDEASARTIAHRPISIGPPAATPGAVFDVPTPSAQPVARSPAADVSPRPGFSTSAVEALVAAPSPSASPPSVAAPAVAAPVAQFSLASIVATLEREPESDAGPLPDAAALRAAKAAAQRKAAVSAKIEAEAKMAKLKKDAEAQAAKKNPPRVWVQVATGANDAGLPLTWKRLREKAPTAFKGLSASSASFRATNRLLVGPFKSGGEAKKTVTALSKAGISTFVFNSEAGQEIAKVAVK